MKIPFDIKYRPQIESGEYKVVTRNDKPVRIVCWDYKTGKDEGYSVIGLVETKKGEEFTGYYYDDGAYSRCRETVHDLFVIIPEAELTELERAIKRGMLCAGLEGVSTTIIKETAKEVKDIICKGCTANIDGYIKGQGDAEKDYQRGYMDGYKAAEESKSYHYPAYKTPCFHGGACTNPFKDCINCPRQSNGATISTTSGTCKKD